MRRIFPLTFIGCLMGVGFLYAAPVHWIIVDTAIHPITLQYIEEEIARAEANGAECLVMQLNTPGGLVESTNRIIQRMLNARIPIIGYVAPSGAHAASAGFYILMATDVAAMAPGTRTGSASPILRTGGGRGESEDIKKLRKKVENDLIALMRSLTRQRGRNTELAIQTITEALSFDEQRALQNRLIEIIARDRADLLRQLDGRTITTMRGEKRTLRTAQAQIREYPMNIRYRILSFLMDPNVVFILLTLGMLGLYVEMTNPGLIFPGVLGAVCLILALMSFQVLPINWGGVALIALAFLLFLLELKITSYGLLTLGGILLLLLGGLMLSRSPAEWAVSRSFLVSFIAFMALLIGAVVFLLVRALRTPPATGQESLAGLIGRAETDLTPGNEGWVFADGTYWRATSRVPVAKGQRVRIVQIQPGMALEVEPAVESSSGSDEPSKP